jgi:hypothetical protein
MKPPIKVQNTLTKIAFLLLLLSGCADSPTKGEQINSSNEASKIKHLSAEREKDNFRTDLSGFKGFIKEFNACNTQTQYVKFPLEMVSLIDCAPDVYDTTFLEKKDYECLEFTSPKSSIINGDITLTYSAISINQKVILLSVDEAGIHIEYFFSYQNKKWYLIKIVDQST